jgi:epoxyqueuosine reductase
LYCNIASVKEIYKLLSIWSTANHAALVKAKAQAFGFDYCGIAKAVPLDADARRLETWLNKGLHGKMQYMENYFDLVSILRS